MNDVDVIVCTRGRGAAARRVVQDLLDDGCPASAVTIVDQNEPAAMGFPPEVTVLHHPRGGLCGARNAALAATRAPVVWFLDDDVRVMPGALAAHRARYADPRVGGVVGRIVERELAPNVRHTRNEVDAFGRIRTNLWGGERAVVATLKGANMSFRRAALAAAGPEGAWFDEGYGGTALLEEADVSQRVRAAGWSLVFEPAAEVVHLAAPSGGTRAAPDAALESRFHNTGRFVARTRGLGGLPPALAFAIARAAWEGALRREVDAAPRLVGAFLAGWREGRR